MEPVRASCLYLGEKPPHEGDAAFEDGKGVLRA
jgi:hypothetical protein